MLLSVGPRLDDVTRTLAADQHPPLFFVAFRLWRDVAGDSEFAGRYFSVLISVLAVAGLLPVGPRIVRRVDRHTRGAVVGVGRSADRSRAGSAPLRAARHAEYFRRSLYYVRWWRQPSRVNRVGYVLSAILLLYTHYLGGYVLAAQVIHMLLMVRPWRRLREALFLFGAVCLAFVPWFVVFLEQNRVRWDNPLYYQNALPNSLATYRMVRTAVLGHYYVLFGLLLGVGSGLLARHTQHGSPPSLALAPLWRSWWPTLLLVIWIALMVGLTVWINEAASF